MDIIFQVRQGIVLVGDTYCGKTSTIKALKGIINSRLRPQFDEFYASRIDEKIKTEDQAKKTKDSEVSMKMFRSYLNDIYKNVTA